MIIAITKTGLIVEVLDARGCSAFVLNLGRENIDQHWVGGEGYKGTRAAHMKAENFEHVALLADDDPCITAYMELQHSVDQLADQRSPDTGAACSLEDRARQNLLDHIISNSLPRATIEVENPSNSPQNPPGVNVVAEVENAEGISPARMAIFSESGA